MIQPTLDTAAYKLWGLLPGVDGHVIEQALNKRETELSVLDGERNGQRRADALTAICLDTLTGTEGSGDQSRAVTVAEVFIDAGLAAANGGEEGAALSSGVRVGPNTLAEVLCGGKVRVIATDGLRPIASSSRSDTIPPAIRRFVQWRDTAQCSIEGCSSRYRLQPHHITERHLGGSSDPENLITVCWYHHHVAIHQHGYTIDPESPLHRRRLLSPIRPPARRSATPSNAWQPQPDRGNHAGRRQDDANASRLMGNRGKVGCRIGVGERTRTSTSYSLTRPSTWRVYLFRHSDVRTRVYRAGQR